MEEQYDVWDAHMEEVLFPSVNVDPVDVLEWFEEDVEEVDDEEEEDGA